ncbi:YbaB/EbfC family nucleoid-associated protein [Nocardia thailandica]
MAERTISAVTAGSRLQDTIDNGSGSARTEDGSVRMAVGTGGEILEIAFADDRPTPRPEALASVLIELHRAAHRQAKQSMKEALDTVSERAPAPEPPGAAARPTVAVDVDAEDDEYFRDKRRNGWLIG